MSPEAQRIAIAEACGYAPHTPGAHGVLRWTHPYFGSIILYIEALPDYLTDLNAMHGAEKVLTAGQRYIYTDNLWRLTHHAKIFPSVHATAAQRAEAFLRTIGKWEDDL